MPSPWQAEFFRLLRYTLAGLISGWYSGYVAYSLLVFLAAFIVRHLIQCYRLERWVRLGAMGEPPGSFGIWKEIYYDIYRLKRRDKRRKKRLAKLLDRFRKATSALPDATVVLGHLDEINWFNKSAGALLGLKSGDRGQNIGNLVRHPEFTAYLAARIYDKPVSIPAPVNPEIILGVRIVRYGSGLRLLLAQDITRTEKMDAMRRDFVANVSHELKTPLTVIVGYLEMLRLTPDLPANRVEQVLSSMSVQTSRMRSLVDDLILLSKLESNLPIVADDQIVMEDLLEVICAEIRRYNPDSSIRVEIETGARLIGNEKEMRSAVSNLVENAVKYSADSGASVNVVWQDDGGGARLDIIDTGEGIPPEHIPRLTERFYRVDTGRSRDQGGTGLGLAIVKHVVKRHHGSLRISSEIGVGSCFSCGFPEEVIVRSENASVINL